MPKVHTDLFNIEVLRELIREEFAALVQMKVPGKLVSKATLAESLESSIPTIDRMVRDGLPFVQVGGHKRFDFEEVRAWLAERPKRAPDATTGAVRLSRRSA